MVRSSTSAADREPTGGHIVVTRAGDLKLAVAAQARTLLQIIESYIPGHRTRRSTGDTWPPQS